MGVCSAARSESVAIDDRKLKSSIDPLFDKSLTRESCSAPLTARVAAFVVRNVGGDDVLRLRMPILPKRVHSHIPRDSLSLSLLALNLLCRDAWS